MVEHWSPKPRVAGSSPVPPAISIVMQENQSLKHFLKIFLTNEKMSNRSSSKQHGAHSHNLQRPKSSLRKRKNKANAAIHREKRQAELKELLSK